jgi:threonyl-tRNA synthetase
VASFIGLLYSVYEDFGFTDVIIKLSTRPEERIGSDEVWDKAEAALSDALTAQGLVWELQPGEGAFYGPKIEFTLKDCIGRMWQCGTVQVDFNMPARLEAEYVDEHSQRRTPVMLHRAILGSLERFIGILIEQYEGAFPLWLAPVQAAVLNITDKQAEYAGLLAEFLENQGLRVHADLRNEKIGFKIREHTIQKTPFLLVVGDREVETQTVAVRARSGAELGSMSWQQLLDHLQTEVSQRGRVR